MIGNGVSECAYGIPTECTDSCAKSVLPFVDKCGAALRDDRLAVFTKLQELCGPSLK